MERCFKYFDQAANTNDCRHALNMVPGGPEPILWKNGPAYKAISSTFLTLMIWNRTAHVEKGNFPYNPGNQDQILTEEVEEQLYRAGKRWQSGSAERAELWKRQAAVAYALPALDGAERNTPNWFDFYPAPEVCGENDFLEVGLEPLNCTNVTKAASRQRKKREDPLDT
ncbi:MAG: hypothetical protein Q9209_006865 [Squamulea sp. 1 TL-2023]